MGRNKNDEKSIIIAPHEHLEQYLNDNNGTQQICTRAQWKPHVMKRFQVITHTILHVHCTHVQAAISLGYTNAATVIA